jgi:alkylation response protein AidB-like acyl-CoA dehydrogenase
VVVPQDLGGLGMSVAEVCKDQERLAYRAPATAVAINMHLYWTGIARTLREFGDPSLEWLLRESVAGEVFAAGHAEVGKGRASGWRLPIMGPQNVRQPWPGLDSARPARPGQ